MYIRCIKDVCVYMFNFLGKNLIRMIASKTTCFSTICSLQFGVMRKALDDKSNQDKIISKP